MYENAFQNQIQENSEEIGVRYGFCFVLLFLTFSITLNLFGAEESKSTEGFSVKIRTGENLHSFVDADSLAGILSAHQVNEIFLLMKSDEEEPDLPSGQLFYPGNTAPVAAGFQAEDRIGYFIARCHEKNIRVVAWIPVMKDATFWQNNPEARAYIVARAGRRVELQNWLSPFAPLAIAHAKAILSEVLERYRVDGVVFDYMRFDSDFASVDDFALAEFEKRYGFSLKVSNLRREAKRSSRIWKKWIHLRAIKIAEVTQTLVALAKQIRPDLRMGITVLPFSAVGYKRNTVSGQDYQRLSQTGINFISPLGYWDDWLKSPNWVREIFHAAERRVKGRCDVLMAIDGDMSYRNMKATWVMLPKDHQPVLFYFGKWTRERLAMLHAVQHGLGKKTKQLVTVRIDTEPDSRGNWQVSDEDFHRLIRLFEKYNVKATWVTVGKFAEIKGDVLRLIRNQGHEIALHGWEHERFEELAVKEEKFKRISWGINAMSELGVPIYGFCAPQNAVDQQTQDILISLGFTYDGSLALDPLQGQWPSIRNYTNSEGTIPVIPFIFPNDYDGLMVQGLTPRQLFHAWRDRLEYNYQAGRAPFVLDVHQWLIGQEKYLSALEDFIDYAKGLKEVEFVTLREVAHRYLKQSTAPVSPIENGASRYFGKASFLTVWKAFVNFTAYFPAILALQYVVFSIFFRFIMENKNQVDPNFQPNVSVFVPAHNEAQHIKNTLRAIMNSDYQNLDITVIDDGSTDGTAAMARQLDGIRVIQLKKNRGKAHGLNQALKDTKSDIVVCIDADTIVESHTIKYLIQRFSDPNIAGVTGNPQIRSKKGFLRKLQTMEYASIISVIKRAEALLGGLYTVSGAICAFRRSVLEQTGGWNVTTQTEDIDLSWRLQKMGYCITYEPRSVCWISVPGTFRGLFRQRVRWCRGSGEAYRNHLGILLSTNSATVPIIINGIVSTMWTVSILVVIPLLAVNLLPGSGESIQTLIASGILLHIQSAVGLSLDRRYNSSLLKYLLFTPCFILYFWLLVLPSFIYGFFKGLMGERTGTWIIERS
ncbi:MAG: glycosyltransferase [bacterium]